MDLNEIKELRELFKGKRTINIFLDNSVILHMGNPYQAILWDDTNERLTCIRENIVTSQAAFPFEILVTGYEHIQNMSVYGTLQDVSDYLESISYEKKTELVDYLRTSPQNYASITGSTGDGIDYNTLNTLDEQDNFSIKNQAITDAKYSKNASTDEDTVVEGN